MIVDESSQRDKDVPTLQLAPHRPGRLAGKVAVVTGAAGNIGQQIVRQFLGEGATVAMLGRDAHKLESARASLLEKTGSPSERAFCVAVDAGFPVQTRDAMRQVLEHVREVDVLVNNAGSAGPKQRLNDVPVTDSDLEALRNAGSLDEETVADAVRNILGVSWNMVRAAAPYLRRGASIINISTIFSRTEYFGRVAYVVPKAALNAWSRRLAYELGPTGIRVNTVFPGPIEGERIRSVFASMDVLRNAPPGTTADEFVDKMTLTRANDEGSEKVSFPTIADVANTIVFLASDDSAAINGHNFEITHGMTVRAESRSTFTSRADLRIVDAAGRHVLVVAGEEIDDAIEIAAAHAARGASVLLGVPNDEVLTDVRSRTSVKQTDIEITVLNRTDPDSIDATIRRAGTRLHGAVILPAFGRSHFTQRLAFAADSAVEEFLETELVGAIALARGFTRHWMTVGTVAPPPRVVFCSNGDDGRGNVYADVLRAALEQLVRVWRNETDLDAQSARRPFLDWSNQIVRWTCAEAQELAFAAAWSTKLLHTKGQTKPVSLYLPASLVSGVGAERADFGTSDSLIGLHLGKIALITGGSAGIGGQIARQLAIAGARVVIAARSADQLTFARDNIIRELQAIGYDDPASRIVTIDDVDVANLDDLDRAVAETLDVFGGIDYLINNAGVAGAEQMVVDMAVDDWRRTLRANLVSNFALMARVVPEMKRRGSGYILNVSSYFGGEKYVAVAYPNRSDYAVSKAGQRAIVETLAAFVGPEIQLNAIAPGPVDGARLRGKDGGAGLYQRRGKLILESRRLGTLYAAVIQAIRAGADGAFLMRLMHLNDLATIAKDHRSPAALTHLCEAIRDGIPAGSDASCYAFLMNETIASRLGRRLRNAGYVTHDRAPELSVVPPPPFFDESEVTKEADKVRSGVLKLLHLKKMPTEAEVGLATVYFLADRAISGETFQPSGGLRQERSVTERELFGRSKDERVKQLRGTTVWVIGESPCEHLARAVATYLDECRVAHVVLMTRTAQSSETVLRSIRDRTRVSAMIVDMQLEDGIATALRDFEKPAAVVSLPMGELPSRLFDEAALLDGAGFGAMLEEQVTNHFRVARIVSLLDDVRLIFVSPHVAIGASGAEFALANFVKTTLHALTATSAVENERLVHEVPVNQINITRRSQSEEPRNMEEQLEELDRFARAIVLQSGPLPSARDSRYRARVYRGMAITV